MTESTEIRRTKGLGDGRCPSWGGAAWRPERCVLDAHHVGSHVSSDYGQGRLEWGIVPVPSSPHDIEMARVWRGII